LAIDDDQWHFGVAPEVGVMTPVQFDFNFVVSGRFHHAFKAGDFSESYFSLNAGFLWETF
jgi:hypothetical protein